MAEEWTVSTVLSQDTSTTNLIEIGHPVFISICSNSKKKKDTLSAAFQDSCTIQQNEEIGSKPNLESLDLSHSSIPTATVVGETTKDTASSDVSVTSIGRGVYLVKFEPRVTDNYSMAVCCDGQEINGSPFTVKAVEKGALDGHWNPSGCEPPVLSIGEQLNMVIPDNVIGAEVGRRKISASIHNSLGVCDSVVNHFSHFKSTSIKFRPDIAGSYFIKVTLQDTSDDSDDEAMIKTFVVETDSPDTQASLCFIHSKDTHVFEKPQSFCNGSIKFRISTQKVNNKQTDKLDVFCQGPATAAVKLTKEDANSNFEICKVTPSTSGRYRLDVFWGGNPIRGNPFYVNFKPPRRRIGSSGLNLEQERFRIGIPNRFRLNCSDLGEGELKISSHPASAADVIVKHSTCEGGELFYQCQIIPKKVGHHEIWVKFDGHHIEESPYKVHFKPRGDAAKCCMVTSPTFHDVGGNVNFQISTVGAGEGNLVAMAEETSKSAHSRKVCPVEVKQMSTDLYEIEFNPGSMMECLVSVTYDNTHIYGSPFKMSFRDVNQCEAYGEGLATAQAGSWNRFNVSTVNAGPGALWVKIESSSGERVDPIITRLTPSLLEVGYRPMDPGTYNISLNWGQSSVPGSPFQVKCYSDTVNVVKQPPIDIRLGVPVKFKVHSTGEQSLSLNDLSIYACNHLRERTKGKVQTDKNGDFDCAVTPPTRGHYKIEIRWRDDHIRGSPFNINVIAPSLPENVEVHCLKTSVPVGKENSFWVDTSRAGPGLLSIAVDENSLNPFKIHSSSDAVDLHTVRAHFCPAYTGDYIINISWSGQHIRGSPFKVTVTGMEEEVGVANDCQQCCHGDDGNIHVQECVTFF